MLHVLSCRSNRFYWSYSSIFIHGQGVPALTDSHITETKRKTQQWKQYYHLVFHDKALREFKYNNTARQSAVDFTICIETVVNTTTLLLVEDDLEGFAAVFLCSDTLANDLDGVHNIGEDSVVDGGESAGAWALLSQLGAGAVGALGTGKDTAGGDNNDLTVREFLLKFPGQAGGAISD